MHVCSSFDLPEKPPVELLRLQIQMNHFKTNKMYQLTRMHCSRQQISVLLAAAFSVFGPSRSNFKCRSLRHVRAHSLTSGKCRNVQSVK